MVGEAGVVEGGVEATIEGDEFTSVLHAQEHFASGFVVVAGGRKNGFDGTAAGLLAEEVQDGLTVEGADDLYAATSRR